MKCDHDWMGTSIRKWDSYWYRNLRRASLERGRKMSSYWDRSFLGGVKLDKVSIFTCYRKQTHTASNAGSYFSCRSGSLFIQASLERKPKSPSIFWVPLWLCTYSVERRNIQWVAESPDIPWCCMRRWHKRKSTLLPIFQTTTSTPLISLKLSLDFPGWKNMTSGCCPLLENSASSEAAQPYMASRKTLWVNGLKPMTHVLNKNNSECQVTNWNAFILRGGHAEPQGRAGPLRPPHRTESPVTAWRISTGCIIFFPPSWPH